jgi:uncharacterized RDD family membrane protein YckC
VVNRKDIGSWIEGPRASARRGDGGYPGSRLGMPERGPGSVARFGRRLVGVLIDWAICSVIAAWLWNYSLVGGDSGSFKPLVIFAVEHVVLVGTIGFTIGHRLVGVRVVRVAGGLPGPLLALARTILLVLAIPPLIWDRDDRGLHDRVAGTVVIRTS